MKNFLLLFFIIFETEKFLGGGEKEVYVFEKSMQKKLSVFRFFHKQCAV